jgi:hypothetical protein
VLAPDEQTEQDELDEQTLVVFGDAPGNRLSLAVVASVLRMWHQREPEVMGTYIAEAITGTRPRTPQRRNRKES